MTVTKCGHCGKVLSKDGFAENHTVHETYCDLCNTLIIAQGMSFDAKPLYRMEIKLPNFNTAYYTICVDCMKKMNMPGFLIEEGGNRQ